jgi:hypothetical protein
MKATLPPLSISRLYVQEILLLIFGYLFCEQIFSWLLIPDSRVIQIYQKAASIITFGAVLWYIREFRPVEKIVIGLFTLLAAKLVFESLWRYDTLFKQFALYTVIYPVIFMLFVKFILKKMQMDVLAFVASFHLIVYAIFMIVYGKDFSLGLEQIEMDDYGPFSGDTRIVHARSVYMLIMPLLYFLYRFLKTGKYINLLPSLLCFVAVVMHQHRSVWSCALLCMILFGVLLFRRNDFPRHNLIDLTIISVSAVSLMAFFVYELKPDILSYLGERFEEIFDPSREGSTGNFRIEQTMVYKDYILEKPVLGWSFEGFTLPNPIVDWWDENTGHHFHQGFIEILFYHGIVGLILKYGVLFYILVKSFFIRPSPALIVLIPFCISGLLFSFNYVLPLVFWGHVGMCLYYLEINAKDSYDLHRDSGF